MEMWDFLTARCRELMSDDVKHKEKRSYHYQVKPVKGGKPNIVTQALQFEIILDGYW